MKNFTRKIIINVNATLSNRFNTSLIKKNRLDHLNKSNHIYRKIKFFEKSELSFSKVLELVEKSPSQLGQDGFALFANNYKQNGYFVEFGATDGYEGSNTWLLEKEFGWQGILAEPARIWEKQLKENRSCHISNLCVYSEDDATLEFGEVSDSPVLSTLKTHVSKDFHKRNKMKIQNYTVKTITLNSLLRKFDAPSEIDFISIDTEGSELEILKDFDFSSYKFNSICIEHNYQPNRFKIRDLLQSKGYTQVFSEFSNFDDWYLLKK